LSDLDRFLEAIADNGHIVEEEAQANGEYWVEVFSDTYEDNSLLFVFKDGKLVEIE
jgi:hypothetical protein